MPPKIASIFAFLANRNRRFAATGVLGVAPWVHVAPLPAQRLCSSAVLKEPVRFGPYADTRDSSPWRARDHDGARPRKPVHFGTAKVCGIGPSSDTCSRRLSVSDGDAALDGEINEQEPDDVARRCRGRCATVGVNAAQSVRRVSRGQTSSGGLTNSTSRRFGSTPPSPTRWANSSTTPRRLPASTSMPSSRTSRRS